MLTLSIAARLPLAMFSIALLVHAQRLTGSFAAAGLVTAAYAIALGVGGPLLGRQVDRRGQTVVLLPAAVVSISLLIAIAVLPAGGSIGVLIGLAAAVGLATPPVGACVRTLLSDPRSFAVEASAVELTWVFGPPLALGAGAVFSTGAALAGAGGVLLAGTVAFALHPASRAWRSGEAGARGGDRPRRSPLRAPALRTLVLVMAAVGAIFGATEIGVTAATGALGGTAAAGPLLGVWGAGSLLGGAWLARRGGVAPLRPLLAALALGHAALALAAFNVFALAGVLLLAGAAIAPTYAVVYTLVEQATPTGTLTEAFAWLATAVAVGAALGSAVAGSLAEVAGPAAVFGLAGAAGVAALTAVSGGAGSRAAVGVAP